MRKALVKISLLFKYIAHFGAFFGLTNYFQTHFKKGLASVRLPGLDSSVWLRRSTSDIHVFHQIFLTEEYKFKLNFTPEFIIDCGANIGLTTLYFKLKYPSSTIVSIEPEPENFNLLSKNSAGLKSVNSIQAGVWNKDCFLKIDGSYDDNWGVKCTECVASERGALPAVSIGRLMEEYNRDQIDLLKIDIEGSELELFERNYERWLPVTRVIMIELHDFYRKGCSRSFFSTLMKFDFSVDVIGKGKTIVCLKN